MRKELLMECEGDQTRLALMEDGELAEMYLERAGQEKLTGNIYVGRVANVLPGMQAAFVDIGLDKNAFLYVGDIGAKQDFDADAEAFQSQLAQLSIKKLVRPGQELLVQVVKVPGGSKGPRITSHITLPGRMLVLLPTVGYVGVSRRIEDETERTRLRELASRLCPEGMGLIVRTAAAGAEESMLRSDVEYLLRLWQSIQRRGTTSTAPALIHRDLGLVHRAVRDMLTDEIERFQIEGERQYAEACEAAELISVGLREKIQLYEGESPLFDVYRVDAKFEKALARRVWLKSGGYLVFDYTEALTVIDVNTGKFVGKSSLSDTVFQINCEAAEQIARQLRLRDIGGIIVIDFIDMDRPEQREELLAVLRRALKRDRTHTNLSGLTGLGLVEMTRKKLRQPVHTLLMQPCDACQGSRYVLTDESIARAALHDLRGRAGQSPAFLVKTSPGVAGQLMLLGSPVRAYAQVVPGYSGYEISPAVEHALPPKTRQIPR